MKEILLLGYSKIARKRVLPALARLGVSRVDIASRTRAAGVAWPEGLGGRVYDDYAGALARSAAGLVYVSTENSTHARLVGMALDAGRHVVVDKPAFLGVEDTRRLLDAAAARGLCIAEAAAYLWHPQFDEVRKIFAGAGTAPTRIVAVFSCPPLPPDNFRCRRMSGGGALWDQGVYAVSPGRALFGEEPSEITCRVTADNGEVDMSFSVLAVYPGGRSMAGHFGFNTGYRNTLDVLGPKVSVSLDRVFSLMPDAESEIRATVEERPVSRTCPAADSFALMLRDVMDAIESGGGGRFAEAMLADAVAVDRMRRSAGVA